MVVEGGPYGFPLRTVLTMISFRSLLGVLVLVALGACDNDPAPPVAPVEPSKPKVSAPPAPAAKPVAEQPSEPAKPSPTPKPVAESKPVAKDRPDATVATVPTPAPRLELDLSLTPEMLEPTESVESFSELPSTLLPPLFDEQRSARNPFQLQGKLITNERGDQDYWQSLEGAELQFEFKR